MSDNNKMPAATEPRWSSYIHARGARLGLPVAGNFELTPRCNFNCKMCYVHQQISPEQELSAAEWIELGRKAVERGMVFLLLTGGEPLIRKDFKEIYTELKKLGLIVSINSNAALINDDMLEFLTNNPPARMNITLYGGNNETYESLCGNPAYDRVTHNILRLKEAGISVRINASITPYNAADIDEIHEFAEANDIRIKATTYMYPPVRLNGEKYGEAPARFTAEDAARHMLTCREHSTPVERLRAIARNIRIDDGEDECTGADGDRMNCRAGKTAFWVKWNGNMLPCGMFPHEGWSVRELGFDAAWKKVREYAESIALPPQCTACSSRENCAACAAACYSETGAFNAKPEYICTMTKTLESLIKNKYGEEKDNEG